MDRIFSWLSNKKHNQSSIVNRQAFIQSLIVRKEIKEFSSYLRQKENRTLCIDGFFHLLPTISDGDYMPNLFELITKKSGLTSKELSAIIVNQLSQAIRAKDFDLCEQILHLPLQSMQISLSTYEIVQLLHTCPNADQLIKCLSILIEKNLRYDSEYILWILIILFEVYRLGDEVIIEHLLNMKNVNLLFTRYGNNNVTPLMLFFHLYSNTKCQLLLDYYLSNINDQSIFLQCDRWNRSYLTHLLCGQCQHEFVGDPFEILPDNVEQLMDRCPHAAVILPKFSMLLKLGNECEKPIKTILTSQFCLPLRMILINYLCENDLSFELKLDEFFQNFPPLSISMYSNYLKRFIRNQDINSILVSVIQNRRSDGDNIDNTVKFLLQHGGRINDMSILQTDIIHLLAYTRSMVPFTLLNYSLYTDIPSDTWLIRQNSRVNFYVCRVIQCGYPSEFRARFEEFKTHLSQQNLQLVNQFIDLKKPESLSKLCLQKLRGSLKHLGDETIDKLKDHLPNPLRQSITTYGNKECSAYFQSVVLTG